MTNYRIPEGWHPIDGQEVWYPTPLDMKLAANGIYRESHQWYTAMLSRGLIYSTREEALACAERMLAAAKAERSEGGEA